MGHEVELQTFPEDHDVVQGWLTGEFDGNSIQDCFHMFSYMRRGMRPEPFFERDEQAEQDEARKFVQLAKTYPWLLGGYCDLDRRYDHLIYMLELMAENEQQMNLARAAVLGTEQVAGSACAGQGFPINWTSPAEAAALEKHLKADRSAGIGQPIFASADPVGSETIQELSVLGNRPAQRPRAFHEYSVLRLGQFDQVLCHSAANGIWRDRCARLRKTRKSKFHHYRIAILLLVVDVLTG